MGVILPKTLLKVPGGPIQGKPTIPGTSSRSHSPSIAEVKETRKSGRGIHRLVTLGRAITQLVAENDRRLLTDESDADGDDHDGDEDQPPDKMEEIRR